jgi:hypothetical protein
MPYDDKVERVAQAIYMTHWKEPKRGMIRPMSRWENASSEVKGWVTAQAVSAIAASDGPPMAPFGSPILGL